MNLPFRLILGSKSPRRQELLRSLGFDFEIQVKPVDETFPKQYPVEKLAEFLAIKKATAFVDISPNELVITSDTVVISNGTALAKPVNFEEAKTMLQLLSGSKHEVITGICLKSSNHQKSFSETTKVSFDKLTNEEIEFYINNYQPFDKAGAYGIQEWIGMIGIKGIEGDFYNVMGLPLHSLYKHLKEFQKKSTV